MFAKMLLDPEKAAFLKILSYLSAIDGKVSSEELHFIKLTAAEIGADFEFAFADVGEIELLEQLSLIETPASKNIVIMELVNLAYKDGAYSSAEQEGVKKIANILGVTDEKIREIEKWVKDGLEWIQEGSEIIGL